MKSKKTGFTILEMVIVICVVAALAAVLIPTLTQCVLRARRASNDELVRLWNQLLAAQDPLSPPPAVPSQALASIGQSDRSLALLERDGRTLFWNGETNRFVLYEAEQAEQPEARMIGSLWQFVEDLPQTQIYNYYLLPGEYTQRLNATTGIDTGSNHEVALNFQESLLGDVCIATCGGEVQVSMTRHTLSHYGAADSVTLMLEQEATYLACAQVSGNILASGGTVSFASGADAAAVIVMQSHTEVFTNRRDIPVRTAAEQQIDPSTVSGADGETSADLAGNFAGGLGIAESPYLIRTQEQFSAISLCPTQCFRQMGSLTIQKGVQDFSGRYEGGGNTLFTTSEQGVFTRLNGAEIADLVLQAEISASATTAALALTAVDTTLTDITVQGSICSAGNDSGALVAGVIASSGGNALTLLRCRSYAEISCGTASAPAQPNISAAGLIGAVRSVAACTLTQCENHGDITLFSASDAALGGMIGKTQSVPTLTMQQPVNMGALLAQTSSGAVYAGGLIGNAAAASAIVIRAARCGQSVRAQAQEGIQTASRALVLAAGGVLGHMNNQRENALTVTDSVISAHISTSQTKAPHCFAVIGHLPAARRGNKAAMTLSGNIYPSGMSPYSE